MRDRIYTADEVANMFGEEKHRLSKMRKDGTLTDSGRSVKQGKAFLYTNKDVLPHVLVTKGYEDKTVGDEDAYGNPYVVGAISNVWWSKTSNSFTGTITIRCPICDGIHTHGFGPKEGADQGTRVPHCHQSTTGQYHIIWNGLIDSTREFFLQTFLPAMKPPVSA